MRPRPRMFVVLVSSVLATLPLRSLPAAASSTGQDVSLWGRVPVSSPIDRYRKGGHWWTGEAPLILDSPRRRGYRLFSVDSEGDSEIEIRSFDLDSLRTVRNVRFDSGHSNWQLQIAHGPNSSALPYAVDKRRGRIYFAVAFAGSNTMEIWVIDEALFERGRPSLIGRLSGSASAVLAEFSTSDFTVRGIAVQDDSTGSSKLLLAYQKPDLTQWVMQWDVERAITRNPLGWLDWDARIAACPTILQMQRGQTPIFFTDTHLYTACVEKTGDLSGPVLAVRIPFGPDGKPLVGVVEQTARGPAGAISALVDIQAARMHIVGRQGFSHELWTYDGRSGRWAGRSGITVGHVDADAFGIDETTGRVYALAPHQLLTEPRPLAISGGLLIIEGRLTPVPQALLIGSFAYASIVPIQVDPSSGQRPARVFVRRAPALERNPDDPSEIPDSSQPRYPETEMEAMPAEPFWTVIEDRVPRPGVLDASDLDALTVNVAEKEGITSSQFGAAGGAYGLRLRLVGGVACGPFTRVLTAAWIKKAQLDRYDASAEAEPLSVDDITRADLGAPGERCLTETVKGLDAVIGRKWDLPAVSCVGERNTYDRYKPTTIAADISAAASCAGNRVETTTTTAIDVGGYVRVAKAFSSSLVYRDPQRGIVVESQARLSGVEIAGPDGTLRIDKIQSTATAWSNGRPHDGPRGSFVRVICGVRGPNGDAGGCYKDVHTAGCSLPAPHHDERDAFCTDEASEIASVLDRIFGSRGKARAPSPDPEYSSGSPGGYVVAIQKGPAERFDDQLLNGDASLEVPALEVIREDEGGRRQVIQLAGVRAVATYGIVCAPPRGFSALAKKCVEGAVGPDPVPSVDPPPFETLLGTLGLGDPRGPALLGDEVPSVVGAGVGQRFRVLIVRSFKDGFLTSTVWFSLLLPLLLATRRRAATLRIQEGGRA